VVGAVTRCRVQILRIEWVLGERPDDFAEACGDEGGRRARPVEAKDAGLGGNEDVAVARNEECVYVTRGE
jgi:hypothetical protein